ncbi:MAG: DNA methyltransferase, partial [Acidobacteriota bacterium]|nr:DNA methyltransferase [Acidobacteriota bacterium]
ATFPWRLPAYCLKLHGLERVGLAVDPFLGLGSSAVAAAELGVNFVGIELDEHYLAEAVARTTAVLKNQRGTRSTSAGDSCP